MMKFKFLPIGLASLILMVLLVSLVIVVGRIDDEDHLSVPSITSTTIIDPVLETEPDFTITTIDEADLSSNDTTGSDDSNDLDKSGNSGPALFVFHDYIYLDELINESSVIVIGKVGKNVTADYHIKYMYGERVAFHEFHVSETLKGEPADRFILPRTDVEFFDKVNLSALNPGSKILLFVTETENLGLLTNYVEQFFETRGDNGIFDLDDQGRAFPRTPRMFREFTPDDGYYDSDGAKPYFDLEKLRALINNSVSQ